MGLFDDLPSAKRPAEEAAAPPDAPRSPKRARAATPPPPPPPPADDDPRAAPVDPASALARLAAHVAKPSKFARAASLAATLMRSGALERRHGKALHALLAAAMHPSPRRACDDPGTRLEYRRLFDAAEACARDGVLNAKHAARLDVWLIHARLVNDVHVDDSFAFAAALKAIAKRVDALPEYEEPPAGPGPGDAADEMEIETETEIDDDPSRRPPGVSAEELRALRRAARDAEHRADLERWHLLDDARAALLDGLDAAVAKYRVAWAQTAAEMLADAVHERSRRFSPEQRERVRAAWNDVRARRAERKAGGGGGGKKGEAMTSFDKARAEYAKRAVSARGGVGGEGTRDGRGENAANAF